MAAIYILLAVIAVGVLLMSKEGKGALSVIWKLAFAGLVLFASFFVISAVAQSGAVWGLVIALVFVAGGAGIWKMFNRKS